MAPRTPLVEKVFQFPAFHPIDDVPKSASWLFIGAPGSGKSCAMEDISYKLRHRIPVSRVVVGNESGYTRMKKIHHPLYVSNSYSEEAERKVILRQRNMGLYYPDGEFEGIPLLHILDDISDDVSIFKKKCMRAFFKHGSRHFNMHLMIGLQVARDFPHGLRKSTSFVVLFAETNDDEVEKLYKGFGGIFGKKATFAEVLRQTTGDHKCMIIERHKMSKTTDPNECVKWYKADLHGKWSFGCKATRTYAKRVYNPDYLETVAF